MSIKCFSNSKSASIRNIEMTYNIDMSNIKPWKMNQLTSNFNGEPIIKSIKDLMFDDHKFDIENMSDIEKSNLRYLVLSTKEVLETVNRKVKTIYNKPSYARLRFLMSYDDFYQVCMDKLMLNDGILKFDANYKFECAIQFWFDRVAGWKCKHRAKTADEICTLDKPCNEDNGTTVGDLILKDDFEEYNVIEDDINYRIKHIISSMDKSPSTRIILKAGDTEIPLSEEVLAKLFIKHHFGKKELSKMMFNKSSHKLVSNQIFNKFYKKTLMHIAKLISNEANEVGETFNINVDEL